MARESKKQLSKRTALAREQTLSARSLAAQERARKALAAVRRGIPVYRAARENHVSPRTIKRYGGSGLKQSRPGARIRTTNNDDLVRPLSVPGPKGPIDIDVRGFKTASEFARYKAAVNRWLEGDSDALASWHGKKIAGIELVTDPKLLKELASKDLLPYNLYRSVSGGAV
jgi:hypothetical protein